MPALLQLLFKERWRDLFITPGDKKKLSLHTLHEPARLMRKIGIFEGVNFAKSLVGKEINFFIFLADSKIVQAHLVLLRQAMSVFSGFFSRLLR